MFKVCLLCDFFTSTKVPSSFPRWTHRNIKTYDFAHCPWHSSRWITGSCVLQAASWGAVFPSPIYSQGSTQSSSCWFLFCKGNQEYGEAAYSNWNVCPAKVTVSVRMCHFLEVFTKSVATNYGKKHSLTNLIVTTLRHLNTFFSFLHAAHTPTKKHTWKHIYSQSPCSSRGDLVFGPHNNIHT